MHPGAASERGGDKAERKVCITTTQQETESERPLDPIHHRCLLVRHLALPEKFPNVVFSPFGFYRAVTNLGSRFPSECCESNGGDHFHRRIEVRAPASP